MSNDGGDTVGWNPSWNEMYILELGRAAVIRSAKWHIKQSATKYYNAMRNNYHIKVYAEIHIVNSMS